MRRHTRVRRRRHQQDARRVARGLERWRALRAARPGPPLAQTMLNRRSRSRASRRPATGSDAAAGEQRAGPAAARSRRDLAESELLRDGPALQARHAARLGDEAHRETLDRGLIAIRGGWRGPLELAAARQRSGGRGVQRLSEVERRRGQAQRQAARRHDGLRGPGATAPDSSWRSRPS